MLTRRTSFAFVYIFGAVDAFVAVRARAHVGTIDGTGVTNGAGVARIGRTSIIQMAQQSGFTYLYIYVSIYNNIVFFFLSLFMFKFTWSALAEETAYAVMTCGAIEASGTSTIVDIL